MSVISISAIDAARMKQDGATLIDIRETDEHRRLRIPGAQHFALSTLDTKKPNIKGPIIFHCKGGHRTAANAEKLVFAAGHRPVHILEGGIEAWQKAGLPLAQDKSQPIDIMRQVQIGAGALVITSVGLGAAVHPAFFGLAAFVGLGLTFAGLTGICSMGKILTYAPWNRVNPHSGK